jgi:acetyl esterase/lipase
MSDDGEREERGLDRRRFLLSAALGLPVLSGCSAAAILDVLVPDDTYRLVAGRAYGTGTHQRVDLYLPAAGPTPAPVVVFFYGGGWRSGARRDYRFIGEAFASRGIAVAIPDYRLYPDVVFPAFLEDCAASVAWVRGEGAKLGADPTRLVLMGHSAGAYNGAMLTLDPEYLAAVGVDAGRELRGFIGLAGPYDFLPLDGEMRPIFGAAADLRRTQPIAFAGRTVAPMLLMTGLDDDRVRPRNTMALAQAVRGSGGHVELQTYPGVGHVGLIAGLAAPLRSPDLPVLNDCVAFVHRVETQG